MQDTSLNPACFVLPSSPQLEELLLQVSSLLAVFWGCFLPFSVGSSLALSLLLISLLQIVEAKSENHLTSRGGFLCPTKFNNLLSQEMMDPFL